MELVDLTGTEQDSRQQLLDAYITPDAYVSREVVVPVFRIGGDEFAVVLQNEDYQNREALVEAFEKGQRDSRETSENQWDQVRVALGIAVYDARLDRFVSDTVRRADRTMYENKRVGKAHCS